MPNHAVIMMADQLRYDVINSGWMPNLEALMREQSSVVFNQCRCASPLCVPARGSFFTGLYPNETGSLINPLSTDRQYGFVRPSIPHLFSMMHKQWDIWHSGKVHFLTTDPMPNGMHFIHNEADYGNFLKTCKTGYIPTISPLLP